MKKLYLFLLLSNAMYLGWSQQIADCRFPTSEAILHVNNIKAHFSNGGDFWRNQFISPGYIVNANSSEKHLSTTFASALWLGGLDEAGALRVAAVTNRYKGLDFWPGPINDKTQTTNLFQCNNYDRHWEINKATVDRFVAGSQLNDKEKKEIYNWPGKGNPHLNFEHLNQTIAPFYDVDGDDIYNPDNGDYPIIKGDQAVWWIINDLGNMHTESGGVAFGMELKKMAYAYTSDQKLKSSTFLEVEITNKSNNSYKDFLLGQWVDTDLGNYLDDFVGCDPENAFGFVYNGDDFDEGAEGFGEDSPLQSYQFLNVPKDYYGSENDMYAFVYYNNDFTDIGNPQNAAHFYSYLNAKWKNGLAITNGEKGIDTLNTKTRYMYSSNPAYSNGWSECSVGNEPSDRRLIMSSGKYKFANGETKTWTLAAHTIHNVGGTCPNIQPLIDQAKYAKVFYDRFLLTDVDDFSIESTTLYPNPASSKLYFNTTALIKSIEVFDVDGKRILQKNINSNYVNVDALSKGLYYANLFSKDGKVYKAKFIKN